jgi:hypothetical protein
VRPALEHRLDGFADCSRQPQRDGHGRDETTLFDGTHFSARHTGVFRQQGLGPAAKTTEIRKRVLRRW